jgi:hypothetical protein
MAAVPKAMTREYLEGLDSPGVKAHAIRLKIRTRWRWLVHVLLENWKQS